MRTKHEFCHFSVRCFSSYYGHCLYDDVSLLSEIFYFALQLFFYGTWSVPLISVILFSTSVDYYLGKKSMRVIPKLIKNSI